MTQTRTAATRNCPYTDLVADSLLRLPLWTGLESQQDRVIDVLHEALGPL